MIDSHIWDGVALTKFLHWIKNINKKKVYNINMQALLLGSIIGGQSKGAKLK